MAIHSDPTANAAIGAVGREWKQMVRMALVLRRTNREPSEKERSLFTGIYGRLLAEPVDVLEKLSEKGK